MTDQARLATALAAAAAKLDVRDFFFLRNTISQQAREIGAMREALEPFAAMAAHFDPYIGADAETKDTCFGFTVGQFRRARAAVSK